MDYLNNFFFTITHNLYVYQFVISFSILEIFENNVDLCKPIIFFVALLFLPFTFPPHMKILWKLALNILKTFSRLWNGSLVQRQLSSAAWNLLFRSHQHKKTFNFFFEIEVKKDTDACHNAHLGNVVSFETCWAFENHWRLLGIFLEPQDPLKPLRTCWKPFRIIWNPFGIFLFKTNWDHFGKWLERGWEERGEKVEREFGES